MAAAAAQQPQSVQTIIERINNIDRDIAEVGLNDLIALLKNENFKSFAEWEPKFVAVLIDKLHDPSGRIQGLATACLSPLSLRGLHEPHVERIAVSMMDMVVSVKPEERSVGQSALKTLLQDTPFSMAPVCVRSMTPRLIAHIAQDSTQLVCLETLIELLRKFGSVMQEDHARVQECLLTTLQSVRSALPRKKCFAALSILACFTSNALFDSLLQQFITAVEQAKKPQEKRIPIQVIGGISRSAGGRAGKHLDRLVPLLIGAARQLSDEAADEEIREMCIEACQSFVQRCSRKEIAHHLQAIIDFCLANLSYDPNYSDEDEMDKEEEEDEDEEGDASDDEDMSWKARRASARCLAAIIQLHPEMLPQFYQKVAAPLVQRFRERVDHVRLDVIAAFAELLHQTDRAIKLNLHDGRALLRPHVEPAVASLAALLKKRHPETKTAAMSLIKDIAAVLGGGLDRQFAVVVAAVGKLFKEKGLVPQLKTGIIESLSATMASQPAPVVAPHVAVLCGVLVPACGHSYYKLAAEALRSVGVLLHTVRPPQTAGAELKPQAKAIFAAVLGRLNQPDQDQEVKYAAIQTMGSIAATLGDELAAEVAGVLPVLLERCRNETTRPAAVRAVHEVASSWLPIDMRPVLGDLMDEFTTFLRKNNRALVQSSLATLDLLVKKFADALKPRQTENLLTECAGLVNERDLHLAFLAFGLVQTILAAQPASLAHAKQALLPNSMALVQSSLIQGHPALGALRDFFGALVRRGDNPQTHIDALLAGPATAKHAFPAIAACVAALCHTPDVTQRTLARFMTELRSSTTPVERRLLGLLCIGEIGRLQDLSGKADLKDLVLSKLDDPLEEVHMATATCLGHMACGAVGVLVPQLLDLVKAKPAWQYMLMHSIKEVIVRQSETPAKAQTLVPFLDAISTLLVGTLERCPEESVRNAASECLGRLAMVRPEQYVALLEAQAQSKAVPVRVGVALALKNAVVEGTQPVDAVLAAHISSFTRLLQDADLGVRREGMVLVKSLATLKPHIVRVILPTILPMLLAETAVKQELRRVVQMGPFKEVVDSGRSEREATYEALEVIVGVLPELLDQAATIRCLIAGIPDDHTISCLALAMLRRFALELAPEAVLAEAAPICQHLGTVLDGRLKILGAVAPPSKQDLDRAEEHIRAVMRLVVALEAAPGHDQSAPLMTFIAQKLGHAQLRPRYEAVKAEKEQADK